MIERVYNTSQHINTFIRLNYGGLYDFKSSLSKGYIGNALNVLSVVTNNFITNIGILNNKCYICITN